MAKKDSIHKGLKKYFGFDTFKGNQEAIISSILSGKDTFVLMPTGGGKSLCYQLPALLMGGTAIIISPLIALMKNQVDAMRNFSEEDGIAHFLNSSLNKQEIEVVKRDILSGKTKMLYVAPESLTKLENVEADAIMARAISGQIILSTSHIDRQIDLETNSGEILVQAEREPENVRFEVVTVSGTVNLLEGRYIGGTRIGDGEHTVRLATKSGSIIVETD